MEGETDAKEKGACENRSARCGFPLRLAEWSGSARPSWLLCVCVFVCVLYVKGGERGNDCCGWGLGAGIRASNPWLCVRENLAPWAACSCIVSQGGEALMLHLRGLHHPKKKNCTKTHRWNRSMRRLQGVELLGLLHLAEWALQPTFPWNCNMRKPISFLLNLKHQELLRKCRPNECKMWWVEHNDRKA